MVSQPLPQGEEYVGSNPSLCTKIKERIVSLPETWVETQRAYLGNFPVDITDTPYADYTPADWACHFIVAYGGIDGSHHKSWVIDQTARILNGTPVIVEQRRWGPTPKHPDGHQEWSFHTGEASPLYTEMVREACEGEDGPDTYDWDVGIAP